MDRRFRYAIVKQGLDHALTPTRRRQTQKPESDYRQRRRFRDACDAEGRLNAEILR